MNETWSISDLYQSLVRHWRVLAVTTAIAVGLALLTGVLWPQRYEATAAQTVEPVSVAGLTGPIGSANMDTERVVATSSKVLTMALEDLPGSTLAELRETTEVSVPKGSQVLEVTATAGDPASAAKQANAVADAYSTHRTSLAQRIVSEESEKIKARLEAISQELTTLRQDSLQYNALAIELPALQERQASLTSTTFYSGTLISPAADPVDSTRPHLLVFLIAGLFMGLLLGAFFAQLAAQAGGARTGSTAGARSTSGIRSGQRSRGIADGPTPSRG